MRIGKVEITPGFLLLAAWLNYMDQQGLFWLGMVSCFLHECGHLVVLHILKDNVKRIHLTVFGAEICMSHGLSYRGELLAACMGPAVNMVLAGLLRHVPRMEAVVGLNLVLACFNLLPIGSLDGGRILRCLLCMLLGAEYGEQIARKISYVMLFVFFGILVVVLQIGGNLTFLLTSVWLLQRIPEKARKRGRKSAK